MASLAAGIPCKLSIRTLEAEGALCEHGCTLLVHLSHLASEAEEQEMHLKRPSVQSSGGTNTYDWLEVEPLVLDAPVKTRNDTSKLCALEIQYSFIHFPSKRICPVLS
mmetsp:Transcript_3163/g.19516  ORF Transcript_3163/g.19516 Transcript_3163/m.19516 type:complete len:108 (-) Transcript_3163:1961-2284(-)